MSDLALSRRGMPAAWWGMAMFVASELTLFALMIGSYFYLRFKNLHWPPPGIPEPKVVVPLVLLGVLIASVAPVQLAYRAARAERLVRARSLLLAALVLKAGYLAMEIQLYRDDLARFTPQTHAYGSIYYTLLGADHAHVAAGLLLDVWLLGKLVRGLTTYRLHALLAVTFYWYAVAALTVAVTLTIVSAAL